MVKEGQMKYYSQQILHLLFKTVNPNICKFQHSHKIWKGSLETRVELAILYICVGNPGIPEPIFLYHVSKCKQTKEQGSKDCLWTNIFIFLHDYYLFFSFLWQNVNITGSKCAIADCNLSKKHKLALSQT